MVGDSDGTPCRVNSTNIYTETDYVGAAVPDAWFACDQLPAPNVIAEGVLTGTKPDRFGFAPWPILASSWWDWTPSGQPTATDSAVALWWNEASVPAGRAVRTCGTYYGVGTGPELGAGDPLTWDAGTRRLVFGTTPVLTSGWYDLAGPTGAQVYISVSYATSSVQGAITRYDPDGGAHGNATLVTARNRLNFVWYLRGGALYRLNQSSTSPALLSAVYYANLNQTQIGRGWFPGPRELTHRFLAPNTILVGDQPF